MENALRSIGYSRDMMARDVGFIGEGRQPRRSDLAACLNVFRQDTDTAVISVRGIENIDDIQYDSHISIFRSLSTPLIIRPEYKKIDGPEPII